MKNIATVQFELSEEESLQLLIDELREYNISVNKKTNPIILDTLGLCLGGGLSAINLKSLFKEMKKLESIAYKKGREDFKQEISNL